MILDIDVGNTRVKWRYSGDGAVERGAYARGDNPIFPDTRPQLVRVSSVAGTDYETSLAMQLEEKWGLQAWFARTTAEALGLRNSYADASLLGVDRWLAMLAAWWQVEGPVCVVDAGSALTIDLVGHDGWHTGGYIIPGREAMLESLLKGTDRVRFESVADYTTKPGTSTAAAVCNGALVTAVAAIEYAAGSFENGPPQILICGGDGQALSEALSVANEYQPDLVFDGMALLHGNG